MACHTWDRPHNTACTVRHTLGSTALTATTLATLLVDDALTEYRRDIQGAAENARSREKTGLKAHEGDEDLVDYYYLVMHPNTQHGLDLRRTDGKRFRLEACPKLKERFPQSFQ